jgi:photosystem II stability/assembly factor-like uncharacterized protein
VITTWLRSASPWYLAAAVVLLAAGCGSSHETVAPTAPAAAAAATAHPGKAIWLQSLRMTSASAGWAQYYPASPANPSATPPELVARTTDGARTWTDVTPVAARPLLATPNAGEVLDAVDGQHAYLAVTGSAQESASAVNTTLVFSTGNGGRTWTKSARVRTAGLASLLSFADGKHGLLVLDEGAAMGRDAVRMYRTADGGRHWSPAASGGIPVSCDKTGVALATAKTGWLTSACVAGRQGELLVSRDGGAAWTPQPLPVSAGSCGDGGCTLTGPQLTGGAAFLTVAAAGGKPALLVSRNLGQTWATLPLPALAGMYPRITFFGRSAGVLVAAGAQGALRDVFYTTADGGKTWRPVRQGTHFTQLGAAIDFASPRTGFAWITGGDVASGPAPQMYVTANSGRTWIAVAPRLDG